MLCPASYLHEKDLPETISPEAADGTRLHELIAKAITGLDNFSLSGLSASDSEIVSYAVEFVRRHIPSNFEIKVEHKVPYYDAPGSEMFCGTIDLLAVDEKEGEAIIIDWKTGYSDVTEAENNLQGAGYALASMQTYQLKKVTVYFVNPRLKKSSKNLFDNWQRIHTVISDIIYKAKAEKPALVPGEKQCRYCRASVNGTCPALLNQLQIFAERPAPDIAHLPDEQLLILFEYSKILKPIFESAEKETKKRAEENGVCGGYKIKYIPGARQITDINKAFELSGLTAEEFIKCCSVSVPSFEKAFIEHHYPKAKEEGFSKKDLEGYFEEKMGEVISLREPSKRLVKA